jgi:hypothetical protein
VQQVLRWVRLHRQRTGRWPDAISGQIPAQKLASQDLAFDRQPSALVIVQQDPSLAELLFQDLVFGAKVLDNGLLALIDPASEDGDQQLPGLQGEGHG